MEEKRKRKDKKFTKNYIYFNYFLFFYSLKNDFQPSTIFFFIFFSFFPLCPVLHLATEGLRGAAAEHSMSAKSCSGELVLFSREE